MNKQNIREITNSDKSRVIEIISNYDEDDARYASETIYSHNCVHYVCEENNILVGICGYERITGTDKSAYLSWTYVDKENINRGIGKRLIQYTLDQAVKEGCRLMFIKLSDYKEPGSEESVYARARHTYLKLGFEVKIRYENYYDNNEGLEILSKRLVDSLEEGNIIKDEKPMIRFNGVRKINETMSSYTFDWHIPNRLNIFTRRAFSAKDLKLGINYGKKEGAKSIILTFPSNLPLIHQPLLDANFKFLGKLDDYYEDGLDELHFIHEIK